MTKFNFRLEKVLSYRRTLEEAAKSSYMEARARRIEAEYDLQAINDTRNSTLMRGLPCLEERRALDCYLSRLEDQERAQHSIIGVLVDEEEQLKTAWFETHKEAEALQTLRDSEFEAWQLEATRKEQADLDEWAVLRRAS